MDRPNILVVMTDHQRGDTVLAGHPCRTPHVERLAEQGIAFTEAYCPSPHCCPARATFMSGMYPSGHGIWNNVLNGQALNRNLHDGVRLWSEDLAAAGYSMHYAGKWHVSGTEAPAERGWIEHDVVCRPADSHGAGWEAMRGRDAPGTEPGGGRIVRPGWPAYTIYGTNDGIPADLRTTDDAIEVLRAEAGGGAPWCLFVGLTGPHDPYSVPEAFRDLYRSDDVELPENFADAMRDKPNLYRRMRERIFGQLSTEEHREALRHYWALCSWLDHQFGRVLAELEATGQADDTLVLYCSDHGDYAGEHGLWCKGIPCFTGAYRVPAVLRWPGRVAGPGRREEAFVSLADFGPTFLEAAGVAVEARDHVVGRSLLPFLAGTRPADWRDAICTQTNGVEVYATQRSVRTADWHYTYNGFDFDELYDLRADPGQTRNLADEPGCEAVVRELSRRLWAFLRQAGDPAPSGYITVGLAPYGPGILGDG